MSSFRHLIRISTLLLSAALLGACGSSPLGPDTEDLPEVVELARGLHPTVAITTREDGTVQVELRLKQISVDNRVASYQGELTFPAESAALELVELPAGVTGTSHETEPGKLRFVGAALDGLQGEVLAVARFRITGSAAAADFGLVIEEVSAAGDLHDLSPLIVPSAPAQSAAE